jgi:S1-C subfamily serine protease
MEDAKGQTVSLGSGFFVRSGIIATNLHVIEGAASGYAKIVGEKTKYDIAGIVGISREWDLVILSLTGSKAPSLSLCESCQVAAGDEVYVVGNPLGLEGTFSQGIISSVRQVGLDNLLQITAPISPGSSGGPVLNTQGKVIGVAVAAFKGGQNLNFAIPVTYLASLLSSIKPVTTLSPKIGPKQDKSILDDLGGRSTEGVIGAQLAWEYTASQSGDYTFSLRNQLRQPVKEIYCLIVFYDSRGEPMDFDIVQYRGVIPAGLAKRVRGKVDGSVQKMTSGLGYSIPQTKIEFRVLDFQITE